MFTLLLTLLGCQPAPDCGVTSTVSGFQPDCERATLGRYSGESRLFLPALDSDDVLIAYLPAELQPQTYGGESGNPLTVILTMGDNDSLAFDRQTRLTFAEITADVAQFHVQAQFDEGLISGPAQATVETQDAIP